MGSGQGIKLWNKYENYTFSITVFLLGANELHEMKLMGQCKSYASEVQIQRNSISFALIHCCFLCNERKQLH